MTEELLPEAIKEAVAMERRLTSIEKGIEMMHNELRRHGSELTEVKTEVKRTNGTVGRHDDLIRDLERRPMSPIGKEEVDEIRNHLRVLLSDKEERDVLTREEGKRQTFRQWIIPIIVSLVLGAPNMILGLIILIKGGV